MTEPDKFMDDAAKLYLEKLIRERYHQGPPPSLAIDGTLRHL